MKKSFYQLVLFLVYILSIGCSTTDEMQNLNTPDGLFESGLRLMKDERYEESISRFAEVKNKHPYSSYATQAELKIADVYFLRETYIEAENAYKLFKEFHPKHEKIDYVTYRLGMSYFKQLPSTIDRDLTLANSSILYFDEVINSYSGSEYVAKSIEFKKKALQMLAEKELYIAHFYFIRNHYGSALGRYEDFIQKYSDLGYDAKAVYGAAVSAYRAKIYKKAQHYFDYLAKYHKDSKEFSKAKGEIKNVK